MTSKFHSPVSAWAGALVLVVSALSAPVNAQDDVVIEEIVVIAERLGGSVQDAPIAITAIGADQMQRQQIENTSDMQLTVPNVSYSKGNFTTSGLPDPRRGQHGRRLDCRFGCQCPHERHPD